eukprot:TRINITY_DN440_c0_g1_i1.p1 TRINITY_DN440_c0_g1~~TRINITY_DN440_c0_g1_i1.p1  ORF type:complete len:170 (-),score=54.20 TRINITY_DN440_c0_g1_i1:105-614(-)
MSLARQNFSAALEATFNQQINAELTASYTYLALAAHFDRDDVALAGFRDFFKHQSDEEREHAQKLIDYVNKRGGRVSFDNIQKPPACHWDSALKAFEFALTLEREVNEKLLALHKVAADDNDPQATDFIEGEFLEEQVESIKQLADYVTNLKRVGEGLGVYLFDKNLKS